MTDRLTITRLTFDEVLVPARPGVVNSVALPKPLHMLPVGGKPSWSTQFDQLSKLVLRLELANGVIGVGEFYRGHVWTTVAEIAESLLGVDLSALSLHRLPLPLCREYDGFECAIWDAYARALGVPMNKLLGGRARDKVEVSAWSSHRTVDEVGPWTREYQKLGYGCIKFKADLEDDAPGLSAAIARHAPRMKVIYDPNQRWENMGYAKPIVRELEKVGNTLLLEDPIPKWMVLDYAQLRRFTSIPVTQHVALPYVYQGQRVHDVINLLNHNAVDGFNFNAGFAKFQQMDAIASAAGMCCFHGSEIDLGILEAMYLHQAVAAPSCMWPSDIFGRMIREHDLLQRPLRIDPPYAYVPDGPGLGVQLDEGALERYRIRQTVIG
jgi:muconate cycloisomerase